MAIALPVPETGEIAQVAIRLPSPVTGEITQISIKLPGPTTGEITRFGIVVPRPYVGESGPRTHVVNGSGGVTLGGGALIVGDPVLITGGVQLSGAATVETITLSVSEVYPLGGTRVSGAAAVASRWLEFYPSGGVKLGGAARLVSAERGSGGVRVAGSAAIGAIEASVSATLPRVVADIEGDIVEAQLTNFLAGDLPRAVASIFASTGGVASIDTATPRVTASIAAGEFGFAAGLPSISAECMGSTGATAILSAQLPRAIADVAAVTTGAGGLTVKLPGIVGSMVALNGVIGTMAAELGAVACSSSAVVGVSASISVTLPAVEGELGAVKQSLATMSVKLPRVSGSMTAEFVQEMVMTFVTNTLTSAGTTFSDYPFNSFAEIDGRYYAAGAAGLYEIEVPQDDVPFVMRSGYCAHKMPEQKRASDFYIAMRSGGDITLRVSVDDGPQYDYVLSPEMVSALRQRREALGKGLRGVFWQFEIAGSKDFEFDNYAVAFAPTARRI